MLTHEITKFLDKLSPAISVSSVTMILRYLDQTCHRSQAETSAESARLHVTGVLPVVTVATCLSEEAHSFNALLRISSGL